VTSVLISMVLVSPAQMSKYSQSQTNTIGGFRMEPVHQFSNRAGFFDLAGCTITDILPRYDTTGIIVTCSYLPIAEDRLNDKIWGGVPYLEDAG